VKQYAVIFTPRAERQLAHLFAVHGVFYGGQDFEQVLRDTDSDD
jgi:hypothetical protein